MKQLRNKENGADRLECEMCDYKAKITKLLILHRESKHEGVRYGCDICNFKTIQKGFLNVHKQEQHEGKRYDCTSCDYITNNPVSLQTTQSHYKQLRGRTCQKVLLHHQPFWDYFRYHLELTQSTETHLPHFLSTFSSFSTAQQWQPTSNRKPGLATAAYKTN